MSKTIIHKAIQTALEMETGETMFLPCESQLEQLSKLKDVVKELEALAETDPMDASTLITNKLLKDGRMWVVLKKISASPTVVFIKGEDGIRRVDLGGDTERQRRISFMVEDGMDLGEITDIEGDLTEDEVDFIKRGGK